MQDISTFLFDFTSKICLLLMVAFLLMANSKTHAQAQERSGKTLNMLTNLPVPYVSIGIKNKPIGTVSDSLGSYKLFYRQNEISETDSIFFSAVGYQTVKMDFKHFLNERKTIFLTELPQMLNTVQVNATPGKMKSYGRWSANLIFFPAMYKTIPQFSDEKGREQATILKIDQHIFLKKLNFKINRRNFKQIKFRLNIYGTQNGLPDHSLLTQDVLFDVIGSSTVGMPNVESIDLRPYNIVIKGQKEIAVSLAIVELQPLPGDTLRTAFYIPSFPSPLRSSFYRMKSEAQWQKVSSSHLLLGLEASSIKASKGKEVAQEKENLEDIININPELSTTLYGNYKGKRINVEDGEIYYESYGKGKPLILLHGNNEHINAFRNQIGPLSAHYQVIAVDTRGHGNSIDRKTTPYNYQLFAADLLALMDSLSLKKADLIGWSDGGNTALEFALKHPERINKMVLMGANLFPGTSAIKEDIVRMFEKRRDSLITLQDATSQNQLRITQLVLQQPQINPDALEGISIPTLILAGKSDVIKKEHTMLIHTHLKNSTMKIVAGEDHYFPLKNPKLFNKLVLDFLTQKTPK